MAGALKIDPEGSLSGFGTTRTAAPRQPVECVALPWLDRHGDRLVDNGTGNAFQIENRQHHLEAPGAPGIGRQKRGREADALRISPIGTTIADTGLVDPNRTDAGHHLAFRQVPVTHDALQSILGREVGMLAKELGDLGLNGLGEQSTSAIAQDICGRILEGSWLNQFRNVIVRHGISLLQWRVRSSSNLTICRLYRFKPSPTFAHSSG